MSCQSTNRATLSWAPKALLGVSLVFLAACGETGGDGKTEDASPSTSGAPRAAEEASVATVTEPEETRITSAPRPASEVKVASAERPTGVELPADHPVFGAPLVVDGQVIPFERIKHQVVLGTQGVVPIEMTKVRIFIAEEIRRQTAGGGSDEVFQPTEADIEAALAEYDAALKEEYPDDELGMEGMGAGRQAELKKHAKLEALFRKVFVPDNPEELPVTTLEALSKDEEGHGILDFLRQVYDKKQLGEESSAIGRRMMDQMLFEKINEHLDSVSIIQDQGLPADVVLRVNEVDITVAEIWSEIEGKVSPLDVHEAKLWLVNMTLLENALAQAGAWIPAEEASEMYAAHVQPFNESLFNEEAVATMIKRFPSVLAYKKYRRVYDSYERMVADQMTKEVLLEQRKRTEKLVGQAVVDVDVILLSAFDFKKGEWREGGWGSSRDRADAVLKSIAGGERSWEEVLEESSDFYDPPVPKSREGMPNAGAKNKGRFRGKVRNQLMHALGESEYWHFLHGMTITDYIFFDQETGAVAEPLRGPFGWYIPKLIDRASRPNRMSLSPEQFMEVVKQDYLQTSLGQYTQELVAQAEIYGLN